ncbi:MAG: isopeptide-forming domain-containing fimbrial protein, partial [Lachnospiraceae bacterium]|nr:isopeptide-forming domain-containing fimbrial protein [Lachnospiraceae bacterium]
MKRFKKILAFAIVMVLTLALALPAMAAPGGAINNTPGTGTITVENAAKGETYKIFKIFDATISKVEGEDGVADAISYTYSSATLPETLAAAFEIETIGGINYVKVKSGKSDDDVLDAVKAYMAAVADSAATDSKIGDGNPVVFSGLDFGYYGVKSTQGAVVSIDSANPNATIYDKNTSTPTPTKTVEDDSYSIGDTVKYTSTFSTPNFLGEGSNAKQVTKILVEDTLPEFLSNVTVTSAKVVSSDGTTEEGDVTSLFANFGTTKKVFVPWATFTPGEGYAADDAHDNIGTWESLYTNGAKLVIEYEGTLTSTTNIGANDQNDVTFTPYVD